MNLPLRCWQLMGRVSDWHDVECHETLYRKPAEKREKAGAERGKGETYAKQSAFCIGERWASKSHCPLEILRRCSTIFSNPATTVEPSRKAGNSPTTPQHHQLTASPTQASENKNTPNTTSVTAKACQQTGLPRETKNTRALRTCLAHPLLGSSHQHPPPQRHGLGEICNSGQAVGVKGRQAKRGAPDMKLEHHLREGRGGVS